LSFEIILILFAVGIAAGLLAGIFGVGGGIIIVPSLISVYAYTHPGMEYVAQAAIATSLFTIIFTSISSAYKHTRNHNVLTVDAIYIGVTSAVTVFLISKTAIGFSQEILKKIFIAVLIIVAVRILLDRSYKSYKEVISIKHNKLVLLLIGVLTGTVAAFTGLGGAVFAVPLLHYFLKLSFRKCIGTTTLAVLITSIGGAFSYYMNSPAGVHISGLSFGLVDIGSALPIIAASIPFAQVGVYIHNKISSRMLPRIFAVFVLIICARMIFF
jgi:uncharacterized protein